MSTQVGCNLRRNDDRELKDENKDQSTLHLCYPKNCAVFLFLLENREVKSCAVTALDLHWGKPYFIQCVLGATWQYQCLCGYIQRPHGLLCPWVELIWALHWITNPNQQQTVLYITHSDRHTTHSMVNAHYFRQIQWIVKSVFDLWVENLAHIHFG